MLTMSSSAKPSLSIDGDIRVKEPGHRKIAYFSMEIGLDENIPAYSGGLGVLAGDTVRSAADLGLPMVAVTLLYRKGYFQQHLSPEGVQSEEPAHWQVENFLAPLKKTVQVAVGPRTVEVGAWQYTITGQSGFQIPVLFLDTDLDVNTPIDRQLTGMLYGGDSHYRLSQEIILGIGGVRMLQSLGYTIDCYHMNEGHAALLTVGLAERLSVSVRRKPAIVDKVRSKCVFTTHTPVPAGHDRFDPALAGDLCQQYPLLNIFKAFDEDGSLNMTRLALSGSRYVNGVAKRHGEVSQVMFPDYKIGAITNGVHSQTWTSEPFRQLFSRYVPGWSEEPSTLRHALVIPPEEIWSAHVAAKNNLLAAVNQSVGAQLSPDIFTIGFARRATAYKRADVIFSDIERLRQIAKVYGGLQVIYAGKAHPKDEAGKHIIRRIFEMKQTLQPEVQIIYVPNYDIHWGRLITAGVDLWLNTPRRPLEASGTSGMKACHNGIPSLSILDGWWLEGCVDGTTGWALLEPKDSSDDSKDVDLAVGESIYESLEKKILPLYHGDRERWIWVMKNAIAINAAFFNTHRMLEQYTLKSYL